MLLCNTGPLLSRRLTELQSDCKIWQATRPSWAPSLRLECGICARRLAEPSSRWQPHQIRLAGVGARVRTCTRDPQAISHPIWCQSDASHDPILWKMTGRAGVRACTPHWRHKQSAIMPLSAQSALCDTSADLPPNLPWAQFLGAKVCFALFKQHMKRLSPPPPIVLSIVLLLVTGLLARLTARTRAIDLSYVLRVANAGLDFSCVVEGFLQLVSAVVFKLNNNNEQSTCLFLESIRLLYSCCTCSISWHSCVVDCKKDLVLLSNRDIEWKNNNNKFKKKFVSLHAIVFAGKEPKCFYL